MSRPQYGRHHKAERKRWTPVVEQGNAWCAEIICLVELQGSDRWIQPGSEWHLAHDRSDPSGHTYLGPAHAWCNTAEGQRHGASQRTGQTIDGTTSLWWSP